MPPAFRIDALLWEILNLPLGTQLMCAFKTREKMYLNSWTYITNQQKQKI